MYENVELTPDRIAKDLLESASLGNPDGGPREVRIEPQCERQLTAVTRDMQALESLGLVDYVLCEDRARRWIFRDSTVRAAIIRAVASVRMEAALGEDRPIAD